MRVRPGATTYYIYGPGLLYEITETATTTNTLTYHYDLRGSTIALTDSNGNVTDRVQYSAYGLILVRGGTNDTPFLYNGRYGVMTDPNGLLYMRARYYNPYLCRFINPDPSGFAGGLPGSTATPTGTPLSLTTPSSLGRVGVILHSLPAAALSLGVCQPRRIRPRGLEVERLGRAMATVRRPVPPAEKRRCTLDRLLAGRSLAAPKAFLVNPNKWHRARRRTSTTGALHRIQVPEPGVLTLPNSSPCRRYRVLTPVEGVSKQ